MLAELTKIKELEKNFFQLKEYFSNFFDDGSFMDCSTLKEFVVILREREIISIFEIDDLLHVCKNLWIHDVEHLLQEYKQSVEHVFAHVETYAFKKVLQDKLTDHVGAIILRRHEITNDATLMRAMKNFTYYCLGKRYSKILVTCMFDLKG